MITLTLPAPPSVNELHKQGRGRVYISPRYRQWKIDAGWEYHAQRRRVKPIRGPYTVHLTLSLHLRRGDCDNRLKAVLDLLSSLGVTPDDRLCESATAEWGDAPQGMCVVTVRAAERRAA